MKKDIHPEYREVLFHDSSADKYWIIRSTLETTETKKWEDGNTYPYFPLDISSASHPFYTGTQKLLILVEECRNSKKDLVKRSKPINLSPSYQNPSRPFPTL